MAKLETLEKNMVKLEILVDEHELDHALEHAYAHIKKDVEIKGFRKGEVPQNIYEKTHGIQGLLDEALNHAISHTYYDAVMEHELDVVAQPNIDLDITTIKRGESFTYTATVAVKPEIKLGQYKGFEFKIPTSSVNDDAVNVEIEKLLNQHADLVLKEDGSLENGDTAIFDFEGFVNGEAFEGGKAENYELKIGSGQFIPGFEDGMLGLKTGEERDVNVTFPENYQAENLKGQAAVFKVKLHEIKQLEKPALNDDFVKELDKEGIETVAALKADTLEQLKEKEEKEVENAKIDFAIDEAIKNAEFDLPVDMIKTEKNRLMDQVSQQAKQYNLDLDTYLQYSGLTKDSFEANMEKDAVKSLNINLVAEAIAKVENIEASKEEIDLKYEEIAGQYQMELDQVRQAITEDAIKHEVKYRKTLDFLVEQLVIK
jgi:trigger factor